MPNAPKVHRMHPQTPAQRERSLPSRQTNYRHWYTLAEWNSDKRGVRALVMQRDCFLCQECLQHGKTMSVMLHAPRDQKHLTGHVDHIVPHLGDWSKFIDPDNCRTLCSTCHGAKTASTDHGFGNK